MLVKIRIFNVILAAIIIVLCQQAVSIWFDDSRPAYISGKPKNRTSGDIDEVKHLYRYDLSEASFYEKIVGKNLFSPERSEYKKVPVSEKMTAKSVKKVEKEETAVEIQTLKGNSITVHGITGQDDSRTALLKNIKKNKDDPNFIWVREGQKIDDFFISRIRYNAIEVTKNGEMYLVPLFEEKSVGNIGSEGKKSEPVVITSKTDEKKTKNITSAIDQGVKRTESNDSEAETEAPKYRYEETPFGTVKTRIR